MCMHFEDFKSQSVGVEGYLHSNLQSQMSFLQSNDNNMFGGTSSQMLPNTLPETNIGLIFSTMIKAWSVYQVGGVKGLNNQKLPLWNLTVDAQNDAILELRYCTFSKAHHFWYLCSISGVWNSWESSGFSSQQSVCILRTDCVEKTDRWRVNNPVNQAKVCMILWLTTNRNCLAVCHIGTQSTNGIPLRKHNLSTTRFSKQQVSHKDSFTHGIIFSCLAVAGRKWDAHFFDWFCWLPRWPWKSLAPLTFNFIP